MKNASVAALVFGLGAGCASAQIVPERLYYGVGRQVTVNVSVPEGAAGDVRIELIAAGEGKDMTVGAKVVATAPASAGPVNLATLFPILWERGDARALYAQLVVGKERVGPPVVLQFLYDPERAGLIAGSNQFWAIDPRTMSTWIVETNTGKAQPEGRARVNIFFMPMRQRTLSGIRAYTDKLVVFETEAGELTFQLRPDVAPNHAWNFRSLAEGGLYNDTVFHRIIADFVIQGGDPTGTGSGGPGHQIALERSSLEHDFGVLSMARSTIPDSAGSQFFICLSRDRTHFLDGSYTTFGVAVGGADAIIRLGASPPEPETDRPAIPPRLSRARLVDAPPFGAGPRPVEKPAAPPTVR